MTTELQITQYPFFSNGTPVEVAKRIAKKDVINNEFSSISEGLNYFSNKFQGKPYNKALPDMKYASPFVRDGIAYLPFFHQGHRILVAVFPDYCTISGQFSVPLPHGLPPLNKFSLASFDKLENGWQVNIQKQDNTIDFYEVTADEQKLSITTGASESFNSDVHSMNTGMSTFATWQEIYSVDTSSISKLAFTKGICSDMEAAIFLDHKSIDCRTTLAKYKGMQLSLVGGLIINAPDGQYLKGSEIQTLVKDNICTQEELLAWLASNKDVKTLNEYICINNPWFEVTDEHGETLSECLSEITQDITNNFFEAEVNFTY